MRACVRACVCVCGVCVCVCVRAYCVCVLGGGSALVRARVCCVIEAISGVSRLSPKVTNKGVLLRVPGYNVLTLLQHHNITATDI